MAQKLISRADLARRRSVSRAAVTLFLQGKGAAACHGDRVDANHPLVRAWLARSDRSPTPAPKAPKSTPAAPTPKARAARKAPPAPPEVRPVPLVEEAPAPTAELDAYADLLRPLVERFGTDRRFRDWLQSLKDIEAIVEKRLANEERQGRLVSRDLVKTHVLGLIDAGNRRLIDDAPKTIARRLLAASKAGESVEASEESVREVIESHLGPVKKNAVRLLEEGI